VRRVVLDNTYLTRAARSHVIETASRHGVPTRCVWLDTPLAQAQVNLVERLLERLGSLPAPDELRTLSRRQPDVLAPTSQMRAQRELEPPSPDEGFADLEHVAFSRAPSSRSERAVFVAAAATNQAEWQRALEQGDPDAAHLIFDWTPGGSLDDLAVIADRVASEVSGRVETALCPHPAGPPTCWCRPPLPGLPLVFAHGNNVDPSRAILIGTSPAHRTLATTLGARYVPV
jgi:AAA domain